MDKDTLMKLKNIGYDATEKHNINDVSEMEFDRKNDLPASLEKFMNEGKNPYIIKCGNTIVELEFSEDGKTLEFQLENYLRVLKQSEVM